VPPSACIIPAVAHDDETVQRVIVDDDTGRRWVATLCLRHHRETSLAVVEQHSPVNGPGRAGGKDLRGLRYWQSRVRVGGVGAPSDTPIPRKGR
jgi:hypothetical protein